VEEVLKMGKTSCWIERNGEYLFQETVANVVTEKKPSELGYVREIDITILFAKDYPSREEISGVDRVWYKQNINIRVREDQSSNIWLKLEENKQSKTAGTVTTTRKVFLVDLSEQGFRLLCPLESTSNIIVSKSKPKRVEIEEAQEIAKKFSYVFGEVMTEGNSEIYRKDVSY
jgi:hypothetical protein